MRGNLNDIQRQEGKPGMSILEWEARMCRPDHSHLFFFLLLSSLNQSIISLILLLLYCLSPFFLPFLSPPLSDGLLYFYVT